MFTLIIEDADGNIADEYSFEDGEFIIGRSTGGDIILPSDNVSRKHARLFTQNGRCYVEDLSSSNGVFIDGKRTHKVTEVPSGAQVKVGDYYLHIEGGAGAPAKADSVGSSEALQGPAGNEIYGRLVGTTGNAKGRPFDIVRSVNLVGRGKECAVSIVDASISRVHAKVLRMDDGTLHVEDLKSSNGCYVNDERVTHAQVAHGDRLRFGNIEFICELPGQDGEIVEVSSGGRKGLIFLSIFLFLVLAGGGTTAFVYRAELFGSGVSEEEAKAIREKQDQAKAEETAAQLSDARKKLEKIVESAKKLAAADNWAEAEKMLERGAKEADSIQKIDEKGELIGFFQTAEESLREDRADVDAIVSALAGKEWDAAGRAYASLVKRGGAMLKLGKTKIYALREPWLVDANNAETVEKNLLKAITLYKQAAALDPNDKTLGPKVKALEAALAATPPPAPEPPPAPVPVPEAIPPAVPGLPGLVPAPAADPGAAAPGAPAPDPGAPAAAVPAPVEAPAPAPAP